MSNKPDSAAELTRLISALLDGRATDDGQAQLESLLEKDADARNLYLQMIDQEIELFCLVTPEISLNTPPAVSAWQPEERFPQRWWAIAAALLLAATLFALLAPPAWRGKKVAEQSGPTVQPFSAAADTWSADFENGASSGWTGQLITEGLPPGSKFGITAVPMPYPNGITYGIKLPEEWKRGLFSLTPRSTLHVTCRLGAPGWMNVFLHTTPVAPDRFGNEMYQLGAAARGFPIGEWQTLSIPFSHFVRKIRVPAGNLEFTGGPPQAGELVNTLIFSSPDEFDLVIDRVWITPDGPDDEEVRAIAPAP